MATSIPDPPVPPARPREPVPDGVRAQILATEHWGLLPVRARRGARSSDASPRS